MDKDIVRTILIAGALTGMAFGAMYVVQRTRAVMNAEEEGSTRATAGYTAPRPIERSEPEPEYIPVSIDVVDEEEDDEEDDD